MHKYILCMASGNGSRFGSNKLLEPLHGKPLFQYAFETLEKAADSCPDTSLLVISRYPEIRKFADERGIPSCTAPDSCLGVSHTIRAGILALPDVKPEDYLLFSVADQPALRVSSVLSLLAKADGSAVTARLTDGSRPGNPVLFSAVLISELLALEGDQGGGTVARRHPCIPVQAESSDELLDLDTPADFARLLAADT